MRTPWLLPISTTGGGGGGGGGWRSRRRCGARCSSGWRRSRRRRWCRATPNRRTTGRRQAGLGTVTRACRSRNRRRRGSTGGPAANGAAPRRCITFTRRCCSLPFIEGRRSKINKKMQALQSLIPNSNKTMLDEAIEYLKQLQLQVQASKMSA
ncbi:uncharacterized protein LOC120658795 [Panicum virgatum]|uniref:uncharacterized protein LOC120658795 n=1 Tax=Panicum virgatum TaxID=38727 RepID=UPI0019D55E58|nr:uncharacterized protein LOC120658795 [Panicum virgatum]